MDNPIDRIARYPDGSLHFADENGRPACTWLNADAPYREEPTESWVIVGDDAASSDSLPDGDEEDLCEDCSLVWYMSEARSKAEDGQS